MVFTLSIQACPESFSDFMKELAEEQIKDRTGIDNAIYQLVREINPVDKEIAWDIEMIGGQRRCQRMDG